MADKTRTIIVDNNLMTLPLTPSPVLVSSPRERIVKFLEIIIPNMKQTRKKGKANSISNHIVLALDPDMYLNISELVPCFNTKAVVTEENKVDIAMPDKTILSGVIPLLLIIAIPYIRNVTIAAPKQEMPILPNLEIFGKKVIIITTPKTEPEDIPIIPESAIGFFVVPCIKAPAIARLAPTKISAIKRGSLIFLTITSLKISSLKRNNEFIISTKLMFFSAPKYKERKNIINKPTILVTNKIINFVLDLIFFIL